MKTLSKLTFAFVAIVLLFASCMKDDNNNSNDYYEELLKEIARRDSTLKAQAPLLRTYVMNPENGFTNPVLNDSTGIWFEVINEPTDTTYQYRINSNNAWVTPMATVKYKGMLLNKTVFDEPSLPVDLSIIEGTQYQNGLIQAWPIAFRPKTINLNGKTYHTGLTEKGLKKGSKIRFVTPSVYGYDNATKDKIPANSPLDFTIEVVDIK